MAEFAGIDAKWWLIGGGAAAGIVWWVYKKNKAATAASTSTDTGIDPNTGLPYSDSSSFGYSPVSQVQGTTPSLYGYIDPTTGQLITPGSGTVITAPTTNAAWAQQAWAYLTQQQGFDPVTTAIALSKYLGNQNLTQDEFNIVQAAIGFEGAPPTAVPAPHVAPPTGPNSGGTTQQYAHRKIQPTNMDTIRITSASPTWTLLLIANYDNLPSTDATKLGTMAYQLAHYSNLSGSISPLGKTVILPPYIPWSVTS